MRSNGVKTALFFPKNEFFFSLVQRMSIEQQINLKFFVCLGKTPIEALKLHQEVYNTVSRTRLFEWHRRFKEGREEVEAVFPLSRFFFSESTICWSKGK